MDATTWRGLFLSVAVFVAVAAAAAHWISAAYIADIQADLDAIKLMLDIPQPPESTP